MSEPPRLDPRPARRLTTREVAKVLGCLIGGYVWIAGAEATREVLRVIRQAVTTADFMHPTGVPTEEHRTLAQAIFALAFGMTDWCGTPNVVAAIDWWIDKPDALEGLALGLASAGLQSTNGGSHGLA